MQKFLWEKDQKFEKQKFEKKFEKKTLSINK